MKWAPNKKLHFEVAIIKAIQSLGQATLDEVIEKLGELRDGRARPEPARRGEGAPPTRPVAAGAPSAVGSAKADDRGETKPSPQNAGVTAPGYSKTRIEEKNHNCRSSKRFGKPSWRRFQLRKGLCETQLQRPMFLESKGAILYLVSRLAISPRWISWAHKRIASSLRHCCMRSARKIGR